MLLQVGFGMSAFAAGTITFISAAGGLTMKTVAPRLLRRFGFRTVLIVNGVISLLSFIACAWFRPDTPHWLIMVALGLGGFFRSLQFTTLNALSYADLSQGQMSRGTTTAAIFQQVVQSVGIGLAASLLRFLMNSRGEAHMTVATVTPVFAIIGGLALISQFWFVTLPRDVGDEMSNRLR